MEDIIVILNVKSSEGFLERAKSAIQELSRSGLKIKLLEDDCEVGGHIVVTEKYRYKNSPSMIIKLVQVLNFEQMSRLANDERCYYFHDMYELQDLLIYFCNIGIDNFLNIGKD